MTPAELDRLARLVGLPTTKETGLAVGQSGSQPAGPRKGLSDRLCGPNEPDPVRAEGGGGNGVTQRSQGANESQRAMHPEGTP